MLMVSVIFSVCLNSGEELNLQPPAETQPTHTFTSTSPLHLPPSYSLALGLDLHEDETGEGGSGFRGQQPAQTQVERSDFLSDSASTSCPLVSHTQELTASELLRNR